MEKYIENISEIFFKYGIKSVTMDDISKELGISKRTLYRYFDDKNEVVKSFVFYHIESQHAKINELLNKDNNTIDKLIELWNFFNNVFKNFHTTLIHDLQKFYPQIYNLLLEHKADNIILNLKDVLKKGISEDLFRNDFNVDIISKLYLNNLENLFNSEIFPPDKFNISEVYKELYIYNLRGIANAKGIEYLENRIKNKNLM